MLGGCSGVGSGEGGAPARVWTRHRVAPYSTITRRGSVAGTSRARAMDTKAAVHGALTDVLTARAEIRLAYVFGSFGGSGGRPRPDSDVDVAVATGVPIEAAARLSLTDDLALATGRPVDLIDLHATGPLVLTRALTTGTCLVKRDVALLARLLVRMWYQNADFMPLVRRIQDTRRERFLHGP